VGGGNKEASDEIRKGDLLLQAKNEKKILGREAASDKKKKVKISRSGMEKKNKCRARIQ